MMDNLVLVKMKKVYNLVNEDRRTRRVNHSSDRQVIKIQASWRVSGAVPVVFDFVCCCCLYQCRVS